MIDELTVYLDAKEMGEIIEESLLVVSKEFWGKELREAIASNRSFEEGVLAMQADAQSRGSGTKLFEPRYSSQFKIPEDDLLFGMPYSVPGLSIIGASSLSDVCLGICNKDSSWIYASSISSSNPTQFSGGNQSSDLWTTAWAQNEPAITNESIAVVTEGAQNFELNTKKINQVNGYIAHRVEVIGSSRYSTLASVALAEIFDRQQSLHDYDKMTFVLTGTFRSDRVSVPALSTGSGLSLIHI